MLEAALSKVLHSISKEADISNKERGKILLTQAAF